MGCRTVMAKRQLVRIVRSRDGVVVDPTGKVAGRGAYLHDRRSCWEAGLRGSLARALQVDLTTADYENLVAFMNTLPEAEPGQ
ncbi:MAG TPA: YlxR family protein [Anaerolineales bacterium]